MSANYDAVKSLLGLLVKKSGYDIDDSYFEKQIEELNVSIEVFKEKSKNENNENVKKCLNQIINDLGIKEELYSKNSNIIGKSILKDYQGGLTVEKSESLIEDLSLHAKGNGNASPQETLMSYVYSSISDIKEKIENLNKEMDDKVYVDEDEKNVDNQLERYLSFKQEQTIIEIKDLEEELTRLRNIENEDVKINELIKTQIQKLERSMSALEKNKLKNSSKDLSADIMHQENNVYYNLISRIEDLTEISFDFKGSLENIKKKREEVVSRKQLLEKELVKLQKFLDKNEKKIGENDYIDYTNKIIDEADLEGLVRDLNKFNNKKEVIYINVEQVKSELIKEWNKNENHVEVKEEKVLRQKEENEIEEKPIEIIKKEPKEEVKLPEIKEIKKEEKEDVVDALNIELKDEDEDGEVNPLDLTTSIEIISKKKVNKTETKEKEDKIEFDW